MKIMVLHFGLPNFDKEIDSALSVVINTLNELGEMEIETVRAAFSNIPYYDGVSAKSMDDIVKSLKDAEGIIFAIPASLSAPNALCKTFFEHMQNNDYKDALNLKNCLALVTSKTGGERGAIEGVSSMLGMFGAYDAVRITIGGGRAGGIEKDGVLKELVERQTEDYYRIVRQNRRYLIPAATTPVPASDSALMFANGVQADSELNSVFVNTKNQSITDSEYERLFGRERKRQTANELLEKRTVDNSSDITEITQYFVEKFSKSELGMGVGIGNDDISSVPIFSALQPGAAKQAQSKPPVPRVKNVKQMTFSLPHYYQSQLASGLNAVIQINITGVETFDCYLTISNVDCDIAEGISEQKDISVIADSKVWSDVLKGKYTTQKAFMIGQLKVRGNFMLLTKFDQLFTLNMV